MTKEIELKEEIERLEGISKRTGGNDDIDHRLIELKAELKGRAEAKQEFKDVVEKLANKVKAKEIDIGEYDKFISVHDLCKELNIDFFKNEN